MSKHTPGPWSVSINQAVSDSGYINTLTGADHYSDPIGGEFFNPYVAVVGADGSVICDNAQYYAQDIDPKNVNLIAAAPDLLAALEQALNALAHCKADANAESCRSRRKQSHRPSKRRIPMKLVDILARENLS